MILTDDVLKYVEERVQIYVQSEPVDKRLDELKRRVQDEKDTLFLIICDEAHFGATGMPWYIRMSESISCKRTVFFAGGDDDDETAYSRLVNYWNSTDHPNVAVLMMTATAAALLTSNSKIDMESKIHLNLQTWKWENVPPDRNANDRRSRRNYGEPVERNICDFTAALQGQFRVGMPTKLVALGEKVLNNQSFQFLCFNKSELLKHGQCTINATPVRENAATFWMHGQVQGVIQVFTEVNDEKFYMTLDAKSKSREKTEVYLARKEPEENEEKQKFYHLARYKEDIFAFGQYSEDEKAKRLLQFSFKNNKVMLSDRLQRPVNRFRPDAPSKDLFLMWPPNDEIKTYGSLNRITNTMRLLDDKDKERMQLRADPVYSDVLKHSAIPRKWVRPGKKDPQEKKDVPLTCLYASHILLVKCFAELKWSMLTERSTSTANESPMTKRKKTESGLKNLLLDLKSLARQFKEQLARSRGLTVTKTELNRVLVAYENAVGEEIGRKESADFKSQIGLFLLQMAIKSMLMASENDDLQDSPYPKFMEDEDRLVEYLQEHLDNDELTNLIMQENSLPRLAQTSTMTGDIISYVLRRSVPGEKGAHSGHMSIVRCHTRLGGHKMKHTCCLARKIVNLEAIDFIQDHGGKGSSLKSRLQEHLLSADEYSLRIIRRIQTDECRASSKRNDDICLPDCGCKKFRYDPSLEGLESIKCLDCHHIHKEYRSFDDLEVRVDNYCCCHANMTKHYCRACHASSFWSTMDEWGILFPNL